MQIQFKAYLGFAKVALLGRIIEYKLILKGIIP